MAWTSPRTTEVLHQRCDLQGRRDVVGISHHLARFGGEIAAAAIPGRGLRDGLSSGLRLADAPQSCDLGECLAAVAAEAKGKRMR